MHRYLISINKKRTGRANPEFNLRHPGDTATARTTPPKGTAHSRRSKAQPPQTQAASPRRHDWNSLLTSQEANGTDFPFTSYSDDYFPDASVYRTKKTCILDSTFTQSKRKLNGHSATI